MLCPQGETVWMRIDRSATVRKFFWPGTAMNLGVYRSSGGVDLITELPDSMRGFPLGTTNIKIAQLDERSSYPTTRGALPGGWRGTKFKFPPEPISRRMLVTQSPQSQKNSTADWAEESLQWRTVINCPLPKYKNCASQAGLAHCETMVETSRVWRNHLLFLIPHQTEFVFRDGNHTTVSDTGSIGRKPNLLRF